MLNILVIEDDIAFCKVLERFLTKKNYQVTISYSVDEAKRKLTENKFEIVFTDLRLPDGDGLEILTHIKENFENTRVILMTSYAQVNTAVEAMKKGAFDYISKPFNPDEVLSVIKNAVDERLPENSNQALSPEKKISSPEPEKIVVGISVASKKLNEYIKLVAPTNMSVLITGESGTGKEVVAKSIHQNSDRKNFEFIAVDCGAIPKEIAGSEFFGHIKGSFTGAVSNKKGHFEAANGGTIFLDEVGNLSYENQVQLLRALQERKIKPIGSNTEIDVDIRLIAATNENLQLAVHKGEFREDLYHRLNEFSISVPSLKERVEDLMIFCDTFLEKANRDLNKNIIGFSNEVLDIFRKYSWPGNLRELMNVIKRSVLLTQGNFVTKDALPYEIVNNDSFVKDSATFSTKENEKKLIINALEETSNNKTKAAELLNITRKTLYNKLKQYEIEV
ncbi:sigma-54-dependent transcriptional regulator [Abyssalbus ytuae]|uniref:Sigma-54 dependent transcriptional regulator n=1 Tax=Abyssalbus ytuae TaxID=2926907 RepID=A0A9E6ZL51_9FLAO|nr:sigma-54 dependent transcriptional regulator [Abyssalbus ytuae]UOB16250.1 sigma-54 dependent transcriptional regulator [Abyssalbus ytuae]